MQEGLDLGPRTRTWTMPITRFEDIEAWQEARNLTRIVYEITHTDRFRRDFGLTDQIVLPFSFCLFP